MDRGVRLSKLITFRARAVALTGPEVTFRKSVSPTAIFAKGARLVRMKRDSIDFRPSKTASKNGFFSITKWEFATI
jgi:hypothetical protein